MTFIQHLALLLVVTLVRNLASFVCVNLVLCWMAFVVASIVMHVSFEVVVHCDGLVKICL